MKETREDTSMTPSRVRIEIDGQVMAQGSIENASVWQRSLLDPNAVVFAHPHTIDAVREVALAAEAHKRRLN